MRWRVGFWGWSPIQGKWGRPEVVGQQIEKDPAYQDAIREYLDRRSRTPDKADAQLKLAAWCEQKGLKVQALTHYDQVIQLDPTRETAWKHLGYKKQGNRWVKPDQAAAEKLEAERQKQADKHWKPILEKLRDDLQSKDAAKRARAERELTEVSDPRAVPMIWALFIFGSERSQTAAVQMLGQIEGPAASNALAALAIFCPRPGCPASRLRETGQSRPARHPHPADRSDPQAVQVPGSSSRWTGIDGCLVRRRARNSTSSASIDRCRSIRH